MRQSYVFLSLLLLTYGLSAQNHHLQLRSVTYLPGKLIAGVWGYVQDGREYALVAGDKAVHVFEVSNPDAPQHIVDFPHMPDWGQEIRTYQHYAYVSDEATPNMLVIDLSALPSHDPDDYSRNSIPTGYAHTLHIDTAAGFVYLNGGSYHGTGVYNLQPNPFSPVFAGKYETHGRFHDGYADDDTLYAADIVAGYISVVDFHDKNNPVVLANFDTPGRFPHNTWLTDDRRHLIVADEIANGYMTCFDVSDLDNVTETDRFHPTPGSGSVPHNIFPINDFAVASWYRDGVVVIDVSRPHNLVEVARYDFHTASGPGYRGAWGAYPWLPSGNLLVSGIQEGLHVFTPQYQRAGWLEGKVRDAETDAALGGVQISIGGRSLAEPLKTNFLGEFKTGFAEAGSVEVTFYKIGYAPKTVAVTLQNGVVVDLDVALEPTQPLTVQGIAFCQPGGEPLANATLAFAMDTLIYETKTNASGFFRVTGLWPGLYQAEASQWGWLPVSDVLINEAQVAVGFAHGYYDGFYLDKGWKTSGTTSAGEWERVEIVPTQTSGTAQYRPRQDAEGDLGGFGYLTGQTTEVLGGEVVLTSPPMDLSKYVDPVLILERYASLGLAGKLTVSIDNGLEKAVVFQMDDDGININTGRWTALPALRICESIDCSRPVTVEFSVLNVNTVANPFAPVECALDKFQIIDQQPDSHLVCMPASPVLGAVPNPFHASCTVVYHIPDDFGAARATLYNALGQSVATYALAGQSGMLEVGAGLPAGAYFLSLNSPHARTVLKLVKL